MAVLGSNTLNHSADLLIQRAEITRITVTSTGITVGGSLDASGAVTASSFTATNQNAIFRNVDTSDLRIFGGSSTGAGGNAIFYGSNHPTLPNRILFRQGGSSVIDIATTGGITLTAGGTNQNITLTPSGTGTVNAPTFNATSTTAGGFQGISGDTVASPSFTWTGDLNTGIYRSGTNEVGITGGGVVRARFGGNVSFLKNTIVLPVDDPAADATTTTRNSATLNWRGKYWNGTSSVNTDWNTIYVPSDTAGNGEWRLRNGSTNRLVVNNSGTVTATTFAGALTGNASTATTLATSRTLWGRNFNGSADVTGSLTSVGNITGSGAVTIASGGTDTGVTINTAGTGSIVLDTGTAGGTVQLRGGTNGTRIYNAANTSFTSINAEALTENRNLVLANGNTTLVPGKMVASGAIVNADIDASAAIADTKLATISTAGKVSGTAITSGNISTSGSITASSFTSTNANAILRSVDNSDLRIFGGSSTSTGGNIILNGGSHSTVPDRILIRQGTATRIEIATTGGIGITAGGTNQEITLNPSGTGAMRVIGLTRLNTTLTPVTDTTSAFSSSTSSTNTGNVALETLTTSTATRHHISFSSPNGVVGSISTSGTATAYNTSSDYRLKENVVNLSGAIDRLNQLPVHRFNFIADPDRTVDGFIAHEAAEVVPECVTGSKDEMDENGNPAYQGIDQSKIVPLLTAALQEAIGEIESLKARVSELESK
jgi:hypothetical protein